VFRNSGYWFAALLVAAGFAFWPRYLSRLGLEEPIDGYTHLHAAVATAWCVLLIVQALLIRAGRRALHRRLGAASWVVGPLLVVASILLTHARFRAMSAEEYAGVAKFMYLPLHAAALFAWAWALAMAWRRTTVLHARFMIATALVLVDPIGSRLIEYYGRPFENPLHTQIVTFGLEDLILLALLWKPPMAPRHRRLFAAGAVVFPLIHLGWFTFAQGPAWLRFADWFRALPLT
jgi:hypothetical protein